MPPLSSNRVASSFLRIERRSSGPAPLGTGGIHTVTGELIDEAPLELGERAPEDMTVPTRSLTPVPVTLRDGFEAGQIGHDATTASLPSERPEDSRWQEYCA